MSILTQPVTLQRLFRKDRIIGDITVDVIINENTNDTLSITKQPVQTGASITDHAFKEPTVLSMKVSFSPEAQSSLSELYAELLELQYPPVPIDVITPKRVYSNMLIASLGVTTDKYTENVLAIEITFQQVILVNIASVQVRPIKQQRFPKKSVGTQDTGKKSIAQQGNETVRAIADFIRNRGGGG